MLFYAVEIVTDNGGIVFVSSDKNEFERVAKQMLPVIQSSVTYAAGEVDADIEGNAIMKVIQGDWKYTKRG